MESTAILDFEAVVEFHLIAAKIEVEFEDSRAGECCVNVGLDLFGNQRCGDFRGLAVEFFPVALFVKFDFFAAFVNNCVVDKIKKIGETKKMRK